VVSRHLTCVQPSSCFDDLLLTPHCASSAGLLCGHFDAMHRAPALAPGAVVHLHLFHHLVRPWLGRRRTGQARLVRSSNPSPGGLRSYASIRRLPSSFNFFAPSRRGESALGQS
jgi:hypothetical protein